MNSRSRYALGAVLLAAGRSRRMGRPKLLLPWQGTSVLGHLLGQWRELGARQVVAVSAPDQPALQTEFARLSITGAHLVVNPAPERGMFSSIQCAARWDGWNADLTHWAIVLGDQPHLRQGTLRELLALSRESPQNICQPAFGKRRRHPVILPREVFRELSETEAKTLREFLKAKSEEILSRDFEDAGLALDLDYPADYEKASKL